MEGNTGRGTPKHTNCLACGAGSTYETLPPIQGELDKLRDERYELKRHMAVLVRDHAYLLSRVQAYEAHALGSFVTRGTQEAHDAEQYLIGLKA